MRTSKFDREMARARAIVAISRGHYDEVPLDVHAKLIADAIKDGRVYSAYDWTVELAQRLDSERLRLSDVRLGSPQMDVVESEAPPVALAKRGAKGG